MPYINDWSNPLDYALMPLKALGSPWGALQTAIAGGDPWEALKDPDTAIRGRQFLEKMGWADEHSGALADALGMGLDIADPLSMLAFGGIGKGIQALRGIPAAARAAGAGAEAAGAGVGRRALGHAFGFGLPMTGAALEGMNEREGWQNPYIKGLSTAMEVAPLVHGGYSLARGLMGGRGSAAAPHGPETPPTLAGSLDNMRANTYADAFQQTDDWGRIPHAMDRMAQDHAQLLASGVMDYPLGRQAAPQFNPLAATSEFATPGGGMEATQGFPPGAAEFATQHGIPGLAPMAIESEASPRNLRGAINEAINDQPSMEAARVRQAESMAQRNLADLKAMEGSDDYRQIEQANMLRYVGGLPPDDQDALKKMTEQLGFLHSRNRPGLAQPPAAIPPEALGEMAGGGGFAGAAFHGGEHFPPISTEEIAASMGRGGEDYSGIPPRLGGPMMRGVPEMAGGGFGGKGKGRGGKNPLQAYYAAEKVSGNPVVQAVGKLKPTELADTAKRLGSAIPGAPQNKQAIIDMAKQHVQNIIAGSEGAPAAMTARAVQGMGAASHADLMKRVNNLIKAGNAPMLEKFNGLMAKGGAAVPEVAGVPTPAAPSLAQSIKAKVDALRQNPGVLQQFGDPNAVLAAFDEVVQSGNEPMLKVLESQLAQIEQLTAKAGVPQGVPAPAQTPTPAPTGSEPPEVQDLKQWLAEREAESAGMAKTRTAASELRDPRAAALAKAVAEAKEGVINPATRGVAERIAEIDRTTNMRELFAAGYSPEEARAIVDQQGLYTAKPELLLRAQQERAAQEAMKGFDRGSPSMTARSTPDEIPLEAISGEGVYPQEHPLYQTFAHDLPIRPPVPEGVSPPAFPHLQGPPPPPEPYAPQSPGIPREFTSNIGLPHHEQAPPWPIDASGPHVNALMTKALAQASAKAIGQPREIREASAYLTAMKDDPRILKRLNQGGIDSESAIREVTKELDRAAAEGENYMPSDKLRQIVHLFKQGTPETPRFPEETHPDIVWKSGGQPRGSEVAAREKLVADVNKLFGRGEVLAKYKLRAMTPEAAEQQNAMLKERPGVLGLTPKPTPPAEIKGKNYAWLDENLAHEADIAQSAANTAASGENPILQPRSTVEDKVVKILESADPSSPDWQDALDEAVAKYKSKRGPWQYELESSDQRRTVGKQPGTLIEQAMANAERLKWMEPETVARLMPGKTADEVARALMEGVLAKKPGTLKRLVKQFEEKIPEAVLQPTFDQSKQPSELGIKSKGLGDIREAIRKNAAKAWGGSIGSGEEPTGRRAEVVRKAGAVVDFMDPASAKINPARRTEQLLRLIKGEMSPSERAQFQEETNWGKQPPNLRRKLVAGQREILMPPSADEAAYDRLPPEERAALEQAAMQEAGVQPEITRSGIPLPARQTATGGQPMPLTERVGYLPRGITAEQATQLAKALGITNPAFLAMLLAGGGGAALANGLMGRQYSGQGA